MRIDASTTITAADAQRRIIAGRIVTYGEIGNTSAGPTMFEAGSITWGSDVQLMVEHDITRPIGRAIEMSGTPSAVDGVFQIAATSAGTDALIEAADGLRGGFSVGVDVTAYDYAQDGTLIVTAGTLDHVGLVTRPAIASARVDRVAASEENERNTEMTDPQTVEVVEVDAVEETVIEASRAIAPIRTAPRAAAPSFVSAGDFAKSLIEAQRGDRNALARVEAAISPAATGDEPGLVPPAYVRQIVDHMGVVRPLASSVRNTAMTATGMTITKPTWDTKPSGGWLSSENSAAATNKPTVVNYDVDVVQWAFAFGASLALVQRSDPSYVDSVYTKAVEDYYNDVELRIATDLEAITNTVVKGSTHYKSLGKAAAKVYTDLKRVPNVAFVAPDIWGDMVPDSGQFLIGNGSGSLASTGIPVLGLQVIASPHMTAGTIIVGVSSAFELRETADIRLSANVVGTMTVEFGVTSFASFDLEDESAFVKVVAS